MTRMNVSCRGWFHLIDIVIIIIVVVMVVMIGWSVLIRLGNTVVTKCIKNIHTRMIRFIINSDIVTVD